MDRLARSLGDLRDIVDEITAKGASVEFVKEQQTYSRDTDDAIGRLMLNLLGAFAEFERTLIRERQREGIRIAKAACKYKGRNRKLTDDQITEARRLISTGVPKTAVARQLSVDRTTLYRILATSTTLAPAMPTWDAATDAAHPRRTRRPPLVIVAIRPRRRACLDHALPNHAGAEDPQRRPARSHTR